MAEPAIAVLPYGLRLGPALSEMSLDRLHWPLGRPARLAGGRVGDLTAEDHLILWPRTDTHFRLRRGTRAQISMILGEPSVFHRKHHLLLRLTHRRFFRVFTFSADLLKRLPNAAFFPLGGCWVPDWRDLPDAKTEMCSLIASAKRNSTGHKLRHAVVDWLRQGDHPVAVMGRGYRPFEAKSDGLAPFRYSVVIENVQEPNYFSEKLVDAVLCGTVPIYWGCPNLEQFFDTRAIIRCTSEDDIRQAIAAMSEQDFAARLPALKALQGQIAAYADIETRAATMIRDAL